MRSLTPPPGSLEDTSRLARIRRFVKQHGPPPSPRRGPGAWLYKQKIVSWLYRENLRKQLPFSLRIFASYCSLQHGLWRAGVWPMRVLGGKALFNTVRRLRALTRRPDFARLDLDGLIVYLNLDDPRMLHVPFELGEDSPFSRVVGACLRPGDTLVDVGANHGSFSLLGSRRVGRRGLVVSFEPQRRLATLLRQSLGENNRSEFRVHAVACADREGQADFFVPRETSGSAGIYRGLSARFSHRQTIVPLVRFDDFENWQSFPGNLFIKLDMEGAEYAFLKGARAAICSRRPALMLEISAIAMAAAGVTVRELVFLLHQLGYREFELVGEDGPRRALTELDPRHHKNILTRPAEQALTADPGK